MSSKTKKEFAEICGIKTKDLSVYIMRSKVIVGSDGLIDDKNEHNIAFMANRGRKPKKAVVPRVKRVLKKKPASKPKTKSIVKPVAKAVTKPVQKEKPIKQQKEDKPIVEPNPEPEINPDLAAEILERAELDKAKLKADLHKKLLDADIAKINKEKLQGLLIPTDLVISVVKLQADSLKVAYHMAAEHLILIIGQRKKLNSKDIADIRRDLTGTINKAVDVGASESHKGIKKIVKEYSTKQSKVK